MEIKRYIDCYINTETCNFRCEYCYIKLTNRFHNKMFRLTHTPEEIAAALSVERLGGSCLLNLCAGGETLLSPDVIPVARALLDAGHYVMIVTNGSLTKRFQEIAETFTDEERARLFFKFSFHYAELKRLGMMERFFSNIRMMRDAGCAFTCELTTCDSLIPEIPEIQRICKENLGALCHVTIARDDRTGGIDHLSALDWETYKKTWSVFDSTLFDFKTSIFYRKRREFCYAGDWTLMLNLETGNYSPCNCGSRLGNIYKKGPLRFRAIGRCLLPHCYNGHSWITLGAIPDFTTITYADERDRVTVDGKHWLNDAYQEVFLAKLQRSNEKYASPRQIECVIKTLLCPDGWYKRPLRTLIRKKKAEMPGHCNEFVSG